MAPRRIRCWSKLRPESHEAKLQTSAAAFTNCALTGTEHLPFTKVEKAYNLTQYPSAQYTLDERRKRNTVS